MCPARRLRGERGAGALPQRERRAQVAAAGGRPPAAGELQTAPRPSFVPLALSVPETSADIGIELQPGAMRMAVAWPAAAARRAGQAALSPRRRRRSCRFQAVPAHSSERATHPPQ